MIILTIKQLKRRVVQGLVEPELFYMPWGKKIIKRIYLNFQELHYINYDKMLNDYPEYSDDILKYDKYGCLMTTSLTQTEFIFLDSNRNPIFKTNGNGDINVSINNAIWIDNIPCGKYYIKIIKSKGYLLDEFEIIVDESSNEKIYNMVLQRSMLKIEKGVENTEPNSDYKFIDSDPNSKYDINCESSGRLFYKIYDPNGKYLGKKIVGCASFQAEHSSDTHVTFFCLKYYPINLKAQYGHIINKNEKNEYEFEGNNLQEPPKNDCFQIGNIAFINLPLFYKKYTEGIPTYSEGSIKITTTKYNSNGIYEISHKNWSISSYNSLYTKKEEIYIEYYVYDGSTRTTIRESLGYNFYYEDGMTEDIDSNIANAKIESIWSKLPRYFIIMKDSNMLSTIELLYPYYENLYSDDFTLYEYTEYLLMSEDYEDYKDFQVLMRYDFNAEKNKDGENE